MKRAKATTDMKIREYYKKLSEFMQKDISARAVLYIAIVYVWLLALLAMLVTKASISEGLFTEATGIVLAVFLIDVLIRSERREKLNEANRLNAEGVKQMTNIALARISTHVGYANPGELLEILTAKSITADEFAKEAQKLVDSKEMKLYLAKFEKLDKKIIKLLDELVPVIQGGSEIITKALKKMHPAPNPTLLEKIENSHIEATGMLTARKEILHGIFVVVPKKVKKQSKKDEKIWKDGTNLMWEHIMNTDREGALGSVESLLKRIVQDYVFVVEQADKNNLHADV